MSAPAPSTPCVKVCVIDSLSALCIGCGRTIQEIAAWTAMSAAERLSVMAGLGERMVRARSRASRGGRITARGEKVEAGFSRKGARNQRNLDPFASRSNRGGV